jgi:hypothetical protein
MARAEIGMLPQISHESVQQIELDLLLIEVARQEGISTANAKSL